jgi:hypothetical protein
MVCRNEESFLNMPSSLEIVPYVSLGAVHFAMTSPEVRSNWGLPDQVSVTHTGASVEFYGPVNVGYSIGSSPVVNHFGGGRDATMVSIAGIGLFAEEPASVLRQLQKLDTDVLTYLGFVVFFNLGIALTGYHDDDEDQLAFSAFVRGAWDHRRSKMKSLLIA